MVIAQLRKHTGRLHDLRARRVLSPTYLQGPRNNRTRTKCWTVCTNNDDGMITSVAAVFPVWAVFSLMMKSGSSKVAVKARKVGTGAGVNACLAGPSSRACVQSIPSLPAAGRRSRDDSLRRKHGPPKFRGPSRRFTSPAVGPRAEPRAVPSRDRSQRRRRCSEHQPALTEPERERPVGPRRGVGPAPLSERARARWDAHYCSARA